MANPEKPAHSPRPTRTERRGQGQSGYTAGRREGDAAVEHTVDTGHPPAPEPVPEPAAPGVRRNAAIESGGLGLDDRFTGRGGRERDDAVERDQAPDDVEH